MNLNKGEYCQFNLNSRKKLLLEKGTLLSVVPVDTVHEMQLFKIYDFHVMGFYNVVSKKMLSIEVVGSVNWIGHYFALVVKIIFPNRWYQNN